MAELPQVCGLGTTVMNFTNMLLKLSICTKMTLNKSIMYLIVLLIF